MKNKTIIPETISSELDHLAKQKAKLDSFRPLPPALVTNLNEWFRIELTYASNALEGNTLTSSETALVVEKGITIGGKSLKEHLEAINHAHAFDYALSIAQSQKQDVYLNTILDIHRLILRGIEDINAGRLRTIQVKISGSPLQLPDPIKLSDLMNEFIEWLHATDEHPVIIAAQAHLKLVTIHPFIDGNGRTARLLMNLLLLQAGYPLALIMPAKRKEYIDSLVQAQINGNPTPCYQCIIGSIETSFGIYFECVKKSIRK